jgi:hypothetical protein
VDTSTAGQHTLSCTARDNAGNTATVSVTYSVSSSTHAPCPQKHERSERCGKDDGDDDDRDEHEGSHHPRHLRFWTQWWGWGWDR